mgnify:CR=1 FL=1
MNPLESRSASVTPAQAACEHVWSAWKNAAVEIDADAADHADGDEEPTTVWTRQCEKCRLDDMERLPAGEAKPAN